MIRVFLILALFVLSKQGNPQVQSQPVNIEPVAQFQPTIQGGMIGGWGGPWGAGYGPWGAGYGPWGGNWGGYWGGPNPWGGWNGPWEYGSWGGDDHHDHHRHD